MSDTRNLEEVLRDLAARGEISHVSLTPSPDKIVDGKQVWRASFAMCSKFGVSFAEDTDPVKAIQIALTTAPLKRRAPSARPTIEHDPHEFDEKPATAASAEDIEAMM